MSDPRDQSERIVDHTVAGPPQRSTESARWYNPLLARLDLVAIGVAGVMLVGGYFAMHAYAGPNSARPEPSPTATFATGASSLGSAIINEAKGNTPPLLGLPASPPPKAGPTISGRDASQLSQALSTTQTGLKATPPPAVTAAPYVPSFVIPPMRPAADRVPDPGTVPSVPTVPPMTAGGSRPIPVSLAADTPAPNTILVSGGVAPRGPASQAGPPTILPAVGAGGAAAPGTGSSVTTTPYTGLAASRAAFGQTNEPPGYLSSAERAPLTPFDVFAGTPLRCVLDDNINTDLPGIITAHVTDDVHASIAPYPIVIPRATTIIGEYNSAVTPGDNRAQIVWDTMTLPDGRSFDLKGMPGQDTSGASGLAAHVDNHVGRIVTTTLVSALLGAGLQLAQPVTAVGSVILPSVGQQVAGALGNSLNQTAQQVLNQQVQRPPTLTVSRGTPFIIRLRSTISLEPYVSQSQTP